MSKKNNNLVRQLRELRPKTTGQEEYIRTIAENEITLSEGPAGCGKTHIAAGLACEYLLSGKSQKIIITRPAVESGKSLGFLPGEFENKLLPYLLPLLDHFEYFLGKNETDSLIDRGVIEIAPLNFMRGRTFNNSFMILDEGQNATYEEIKMFLTRIGFKSKAIINGDASQSDLPHCDANDFKKVIKKLENTDLVGIVILNHLDIVRNPIISKILTKL